MIKPYFIYLRKGLRWEKWFHVEWPHGKLIYAYKSEFSSYRGVLFFITYPPFWTWPLSHHLWKSFPYTVLENKYSMEVHKLCMPSTWVDRWERNMDCNLYSRVQNSDTSFPSYVGVLKWNWRFPKGPYSENGACSTCCVGRWGKRIEDWDSCGGG